MSLRILHTADWHLGQTFHGYDRDPEHAAFLDWLLATLIAQQPDAVLLAGDVFDTVNPSALSLRRFYTFLAAARAALPQLQFVITAGNHDAAARLEAPAGLFEAFQIRVVGTVPRDASGQLQPEQFIVPLSNATGAVEALVLAVPFLRPSDVPAIPDAKDPYLDGIKELYRLATAAAEQQRETMHPQAALIALGHCHLAGATESQDSERRLIIGGAESLRPDTFPAALAYVALGHLHKPQEIDGGRIRYCGSPLPLSFSERDYDHRVLQLTVAEGRVTEVMPLPIPRFVRLMRVPSRDAVALDEVLQQLATLAEGSTVASAQWPFLEVHVLDDGPDPRRRHRIETALHGKAVRLASIKLVAPAREGSNATTHANAAALVDAAALNTLEAETLMTEAYQEKYGAPPGPELLACLREILLAETTVDTARPVAPATTATASRV